MDDILGLARPDNFDAVRRIKGWVRDAGGLDDRSTIMVSELHCHEPGCPEIETIIAVMRPDAVRLQVKFEAPMADVTRAAVAARFRNQSLI